MKLVCDDAKTANPPKRAKCPKSDHLARGSEEAEFVVEDRFVGAALGRLLGGRFQLIRTLAFPAAQTSAECGNSGGAMLLIRFQRLEEQS
jgi:hypothetical protein